MSKWYNFYKDRVNSNYQEYFEKRYFVFLQCLLRVIREEELRNILDMGCGIGSICKFLDNLDILTSNFCYYGYDINNDMIDLAILNNEKKGCISFDQFDIFNTAKLLYEKSLFITHGVLEHFRDNQILSLLKLFPFSLHYVPLDKYVSPSFGDERLLPVEYWINLLDLHKYEYRVFNQGKDLLFLIDKRKKS